MFDDLYKKIINKTFIKFDEFYDIIFYVSKNENNKLTISDQFFKNSDKINIKCRKLSIENWDLILEEDDDIAREKILLLFSICKTNLLDLNFVNNTMDLQSLSKILNLNTLLIKYIIKKINHFYKNKHGDKYRGMLALQFKKLHRAKKGIVLKHKEIGTYLQSCAFWDKLGLNYFDLKKLPYDVYKEFTMLMNIETEIKNAEMQIDANKNNNRGRR